MKKIIYIAISVIFTVLFSGCEDFLDTQNYTKKIQVISPPQWMTLKSH